MAEQTQTTEIASKSSTNTGGGLISNIGDTLEKIKRFSNEPAVQRSIPVMITLFVIFIGMVFFISFREPSRTTLFSSLPEHEKSRVIDVLRSNGIDVSIDSTTGEVLVPSPEYYEAKMKLAAEGLPSSVPQGYDLLEKIPMGTSRSVEFMKMKQTQEIELARSINEISYVLGARVHLAIPERSVFVRDAGSPTASVFVKLADGRVLNREQVRAIVHIVSSSIPNMSSDNVTVVDQYGKLLSKPEDDPNIALTEKQLNHRIKIESLYRERILSLVTPMVGAGNLTAQVNVEMDFANTQVTEETFDPESISTRSEQNSADESTDRPARGVPGAVANQAPLAADLQIDTPTEASEQEFKQRSTSNVKNYEVSKKLSTTIGQIGKIRKVKTAVLVKNKIIQTPEGTVTEPLSDEEKEKISSLVKEAVGFNGDRGDSIVVTSGEFIEELQVIVTKWYEQAWFQNIAGQISTVLILAIITFGALKPLLNRILVPSAGVAGAGGPGGAISEADLEAEEEGEVEVQEGESLEDIKAKLKPKKAAISAEMLDTANTYDDKVAVIRMIVGDEAGKVSNVFRQLMKKDAL
ncbi:MAG: flagellar M-ring protein FliF [Rickettsiales bacterium]|nr:flagellar M-ring protein FliF [Rickettsiales bacterium]|tara:strand:+ start:1616 stop:3352 length:1737 start_codon:yes stop_codon:yes gene_type:complete